MKLNSNGFGTVGVVLIVVIVGILGFVGYTMLTTDKNNSGTSAVQQDESSESKEEVKAAVITTGDSEFGTMLFNDKKQAIYIWEVEKSETAECYGACAEAWPPVLTDGTPQAAGDVDVDLLGTTERTDGTTQVTYNGHPLYYYAHEGPGEVKCHNISTHGGLWWVITPSGDRAD